MSFCMKNCVFQKLNSIICHENFKVPWIFEEKDENSNDIQSMLQRPENYIIQVHCNVGHYMTKKTFVTFYI